MIWEQIERDWLGGGRIAMPPEAAVEAFNRAESVLGSNWMSQCRGLTGTGSGISPTLSVINTGQRLAVLDGVGGTDHLSEKIHQGDHSASAELTAIFLLKSGRSDTCVELEPEIPISGSKKKPDFRISALAANWTYVEVTQPNPSEEYERAESIMKQIVGLVIEIKKAFSLEVFLRRIPSDNELNQIKALLPSLCIMDGVHREDMGDLGFLYLNLDPPGQLNLRDHQGEESRQRISMAQFIYGFGTDEPHRHIAVRLAFSDERARQFLWAEARQLPKDAPGLIMVQVANAPGAFKTWEPILRRLLQPNLHTRISAICLFNSSLESTSEGEAWIPRTKLILNTNAKHPLPDWAGQQLARFASDW
jgi:hypothetical protein